VKVNLPSIAKENDIVAAMLRKQQPSRKRSGAVALAESAPTPVVVPSAAAGSVLGRLRAIQPVDLVRKERFQQTTVRRCLEAPGRHVSQSQPTAYSLAITREHPRMMKNQFHTNRVEGVGRLTIVRFLNFTTGRPTTTHRVTGELQRQHESVAAMSNGTLNNSTSRFTVYREFLAKQPELLDPRTFAATCRLGAGADGSGPSVPPAIAAGTSEGAEAAMRKQREALVDLRRHQQSLLPENFALLQTRYEDAANECQLSVEDRKQYPFLGKEVINPNMPYCLIPTALGGPTSSQWDEFPAFGAHEFEGGSIVNGIERYMVTSDRPSYNRSMVTRKIVGKRTFVNVELRAEHTDMYRSTSTLNLQLTSWSKMQRNENLVLIPYVPDPVHLHELLRALGWTDDLENNVTVEDKIAAEMYRRARNYFAHLRTRPAARETATVVLAEAEEGEEREERQERQEVPLASTPESATQRTTKKQRVDPAARSLSTATAAEDHDDDEPVVDQEERDAATTARMLEIRRKMEAKERLNLAEMMHLVRISMPRSEVVLAKHRLWQARKAEAARSLLQDPENEVEHVSEDDEEDVEDAAGDVNMADRDAPHRRRLLSRNGCGLRSCICAEIRRNAKAGDLNAARLQAFVTGAITRAKRKLRRRPGQLPCPISQEEALLSIASSVDDPGRQRKYMYPASSATVGEANGGAPKHARTHRAVHVPARPIGAVTVSTHEQKAKASDDRDRDQNANANANADADADEAAAAITGVHVTAEQKAQYCATFLAKQKMIHACRRTVLKECCPNVAILGESLGWSEEEICRRKADAILDMFWRGLLSLSRNEKEDDGTSQGVKNNDDVNMMLTGLCRQLFRKTQQGFSRLIVKRHDAGQVFPLREMQDVQSSKRLYKAYSTGVWSDGGSGPLAALGGMRRINKMKSGATQLRNIANRVTPINQLNRVMYKVNQRSKQTGQRQVNDVDGHKDPFFSPEGENAGIIAVLALLSHRSQGCDDSFLIRWLLRHSGMALLDGSVDLRLVNEMKGLGREGAETQASTTPGCDIFVGSQQLNGKHAHPKRLVHQFRLLRRARFFAGDISCRYEKRHNRIIFDTSAGRYMRPLFVGKRLLELNLKHGVDALDRMTWEDHLRNCTIEYLDTNEELTVCQSPDEFVARLASGEPVEYIVIHPVAMLCATTGLIPFGAHNMATRLQTMSGMWTQAMGMYSILYRLRFDSTAISFNLVYPERPLVLTLTEDVLDLGSYPMGQNANLCTGTWFGLGQDDSVIINGGSIGNGLHMAIGWATCSEEARSYGVSATGGFGGASSRTHNDFFCNPLLLPSQAQKDASYEWCDEDGHPLVGSNIPSQRAVIYGKVLPTQRMVAGAEDHQSGDAPATHRQTHYHDKSAVSNQKHCGIVDACITTTNHRGATLSKTHFMRWMPPEIGDKFCSRHGQKMSCGFIFPEWMMPYDYQGVRVDVSDTMYA
jgi:DNA-directed RNA polymerase beta subunit